MWTVELQQCHLSALNSDLTVGVPDCFHNSIGAVTSRIYKVTQIIVFCFFDVGMIYLRSRHTVFYPAYVIQFSCVLIPNILCYDDIITILVTINVLLPENDICCAFFHFFPALLFLWSCAAIYFDIFCHFHFWLTTYVEFCATHPGASSLKKSRGRTSCLKCYFTQFVQCTVNHHSRIQMAASVVVLVRWNTQFFERPSQYYEFHIPELP